MDGGLCLPRMTLTWILDDADSVRPKIGKTLTTGAKILSLLSWLGVLALIFVALIFAELFGFIGLLLLGLLTVFICTMAELDEDLPTWSRQALRAHLHRPRSPEERAAKLHERLSIVAPLTFGKRCGGFLAVVGLAGCVWQVWNG